MNSAEDIIALITTILIVSLLANLYFINSKLMRAKKERREDKLGAEKTQKYLRSQSEKTRFYKGTEEVPDLNSRVVKFRSAYLLIEAKAIEKKQVPDSFWRFIDDKVKQLIEIMLTHASNPSLDSIAKKITAIKNLVQSSDAAEDKDIIFSCLDRFHRSCIENSNVNRLKRYDNKLNDILSKISDKQFSSIDRLTSAREKYTKRAKSTLDAIPELNRLASDGKPDRHHKIESLVKGINKNSQQLDDSLSSIRSDINVMDQSFGSVDGADDQYEVEPSSSARELELLSQELQQKSEAEVRRLKRVVRDQKVSISELEVELSRLARESKKSGSMRHDENEEQLEAELSALKQNLTQSEQCIQILESELDSLKEQINEAKISANGGVLAELEDAIKSLEASLKLSEADGEYLKAFLIFVRESVSLESQEDLAVSTHATIAELGYGGQFIVQTPDRQFVVSDSGTISEKLKMLLGNLALDESSLTTDKKSMFCRKSSFSCVVTTKGGGAITSSDATRIMNVLDVSDNLMRKISGNARQKELLKKIGGQCDDIKRKSRDLDHQLNEVFISLAKATEASSSNIQSLARASGMSASNIAKLKNYENDILDEIEDSKLVNLKVKKAFVSILNDLEDMY